MLGASLPSRVPATASVRPRASTRQPLESATGRTISPSDASSYQETDTERQCLYQVDGSDINELIIEASDDIAKGERLADAPVFQLGPLARICSRPCLVLAQEA